MENIEGMKTIFPKFKINPLTYIIVLSFLLTGFIKNIILIFSIVFFHELGHLFFLKIFHYEVVRVELFPFGGLTTTDKFINSPINKDLIIYFGGALFQLFLYAVFYFFYRKGFILNSTYHLFLSYNTSILFFNLLPIKPLDGGMILELFLQKYFSFVTSITLSIPISLFFLFLFILYNIKSNLNSLIVISFLLYKIWDAYKKKEYYKNKFLLERYLYTFPYKKIEHNEKKDLLVLKKETLHFFKEQQKYRHEKEILKEKFDIHSYF